MAHAQVGDISSEKIGERIFQNTLTLIAGRGFSLIFSGAASILLARYLGAERFGTYGSLYAYLGLYGWLATFGLEPILAREAAQHRDQASSILLTGVMVCGTFSLLAAGASLALAPFLGYGGNLRLLLLFAAFDTLLLAPFRLPGIIFQVDLRQWYGVGVDLIKQVFWLATLVALAWLKAGLLWVILGRLATDVLGGILILLAIQNRRFLLPPWKFLPAEAQRYLSFGLPIAVSTLAVGIYHRIDQVMLHKMAGDQVLGGYVAAVNVAELFGLLPVALMGSMFPILSRVSGEPERFSHYLQLSYRALLVVAFGACTLVTPLAGPIVRLLYGAKFAVAGPLLAVLIWSEAAVFFGVVLSNALVAKNLQGFLPLATAVGAAVNVVLNLMWIPRWGALGSAWATNISYAIASVFLFLVFARTRPMAMLGLRVAAPPFFLGLAIAAGMSTSTFPVPLVIFLVIFLYSLGAWTTGTVRRSEVQRLWELIERSLAHVRPIAN